MHESAYGSNKIYANQSAIKHNNIQESLEDSVRQVFEEMNPKTLGRPD